MAADIGPDGFGTWDISGRTCTESVLEALDAGYRHVDTAQMYGNEREVGAALDRSPVPREDVYVATKVWHDRLSPDGVRRVAAGSRERLGVDTIDLLYVHWPTGAYDAETTLPAFDELVDDGAVRHVGLSNFSPALLDEARDVLSAPIAAHQVEMHPLLPQAELLDYAERRGHHLVAYCPIARGRVLDVPEVRSVADKHGVSPAAASIAWIAAKGAIPIPRSSDPAHIRENHAAVSLELDDEDVATIDAIDREERVVNPGHAVWNR